MALTQGKGHKKYFTRRGIARWLVNQLQSDVPTVVGVDHAFSFPQAYFKRYQLPADWDAFLADFVQHWPADRPGVRVDDLRFSYAGQARWGDARWRREAERRARAKSVFHFDVPGSVAKSTHAGLPWL